jgi:20S proteasome alpha/beta subunit
VLRRSAIIARNERVVALRSHLLDGFRREPIRLAFVTLVVGIKAGDGIVLAADGRTTLTAEGRRYPPDDETKKIFPSKNGRFGFGVAGLAGAALYAINKICAMDDSHCGIKDFAHVTGQELQRAFAQHFERDEPLYWPSVDILLGGCNGRAVAEMYDLQSACGFLPTPAFKPAWKVGSFARDQLVQSLLDMQPTAMNVAQAKKAAVFIIRAVGTIDQDVGGKICMAVVAEGRYEEVLDAEVAKIEEIVSQVRTQLTGTLQEALMGPFRPHRPPRSKQPSRRK